MPARKSIRRPKRRAGRKPVKRVRKAGAKAVRKDYAALTESVETQIVLPATGEVGQTFTTSLSAFQRAQEVAHAYKYYRCKRVELIFVPYSNISLVGTGVAARLPQMYFAVDRVANQYIIPTEAEMLSRGVNPRLFKKTMKFAWTPNLLQNVQMECNQPADGGGLPLGIDAINAINSVPLYNKWLPTQQSYGYGPQRPNQQLATTMIQPASNPYALRYYGATWVINQEQDGVSQPIQAVGDLMIKVTWEFKDARALVTEPPQIQTNVSQATSTMNGTVVANTQPTTYP